MPVSAVITSRTNPRVKQLRAALAGNARLSNGLIGIEGPNLIGEAFRSNIPVATVFLADGTSPPHYLPAGIELLHLSREVFDSASSCETPQGMAALLEPPDLIPPLDGNPLLLIAAGLQDPGNLGTLIRSAEAFAAAGVLLTPGTVSPWNGKTMRASAGSIFRVPVQTIGLDELATLSARGIRLLAAVTGDSAPHYASTVPIAQVDLTAACAFLIGNEGVGLSADLLALTDTRITIPTPGPVESLNAAVAGSLLLYEASLQRRAFAVQSARANDHRHTS